MVCFDPVDDLLHYVDRVRRVSELMGISLLVRRIAHQFKLRAGAHLFRFNFVVRLLKEVLPDLVKLYEKQYEDHDLYDKHLQPKHL